MTTRELAQAATAIENGAPLPNSLPAGRGLIVGVTGPPGAGKSSLVDALTAEFRRRGQRVAIVAVDPSSRATGGAILGDRIRMTRHHADDGVFIRSMATRGAIGGLARATIALSHLFRGAGFDYIFVETVGVGQDEIDIASHADVTAVVLVPGMGDDVQAIKAGIMEVADLFVINKADRPGVEQTQREIEAMLSLGHAEVSIFRTVATENKGVAELTDALAAHQPREHTFQPEAPWEIDHLGIAVNSIDEALPFYATHLGMSGITRETVEHEKVRVAMIPAGASRIELLEPTGPESPIAKFLAKRGPGLHHVALRVSDLNAVATRLRAAGIRLLNEPRQGAGGHTYVFVHPSSTGGVLWELVNVHHVQ
jgi:LAO/AO transport system kinase